MTEIDLQRLELVQRIFVPEYLPCQVVRCGDALHSAVCAQCPEIPPQAWVFVADVTSAEFDSRGFLDWFERQWLRVYYCQIRSLSDSARSFILRSDIDWKVVQLDDAKLLLIYPCQLRL